MLSDCKPLEEIALEGRRVMRRSGVPHLRKRMDGKCMTPVRSGEWERKLQRRIEAADSTSRSSAIPTRFRKSEADSSSSRRARLRPRLGAASAIRRHVDERHTVSCIGQREAGGATMRSSQYTARVDIWRFIGVHARRQAHVRKDRDPPHAHWLSQMCAQFRIVHFLYLSSFGATSWP